MIQRIQTVYFLLIVIFSCCTFYLPVANLYNPSTGVIVSLDYNGFFLTGEHPEKIITTWMLNIISGLIPLIAFVSIFLYKKRITQLRLSFLNIFLMLGYYIILAIYLWQAAKGWDMKWSLEIPAAFPLICVILCWLAIRAIGRDEALVKSLNRLR